MNSSATVAIFPSQSSPYVVLDVEKIRAAMDRRRVNATELAVRAGVSVPVISRILREKPVQRHKAALVIRAILATTEGQSMGDFLSDTIALAS
jgi:transcriptional regulator with XRE-family HTH domain